MDAMPEGCAAEPGAQSTQVLDEYIRKEDIARQFGRSTRTIERWVRLRLLPAPVRLGRISFHHVPTIKKHLAKQLEPEPRRRRRP